MTGISYERLAVIVICLGVIAALFVTCVLVLCCKLLYKMNDGNGKKGQCSHRTILFDPATTSDDNNAEMFSCCFEESTSAPPAEVSDNIQQKETSMVELASSSQGKDPSQQLILSKSNTVTSNGTTKTVFVENTSYVDINSKIEGSIVQEEGQQVNETSFITAKVHPTSSQEGNFAIPSDRAFNQQPKPGRLFIKQDRSRRFGRSMTMTATTTVEPLETSKVFMSSVETLSHPSSSKNSRTSPVSESGVPQQVPHVTEGCTSTAKSVNRIESTESDVSTTEGHEPKKLKSPKSIRKEYQELWELRTALEQQEKAGDPDRSYDDEDDEQHIDSHQEPLTTHPFSGSCVEGSTIGCSIDQPLNTERVRGSRFLMNAVSKGIPVLESLKTTRSNHPSIEEEDGTEDMDAEEKTTATSCLPENNSESNIGKEGTTGGDETEDEESAIFV